MLLLRLRPSKLLLAVRLAIHLAALLALAHTRAWQPLLLVLGLLTCCSLVRSVRALEPGRGTVPLAIQLHAGRGRLHYPDRIESTAAPRPRYVGEFLIVLEFVRRRPRRGSARLLLPLLPGMLSADEDRRLRRYLRFQLAD